ncbi:hypothetical protein SRHO_G00026680 [Serrasalmus rhombeus]
MSCAENEDLSREVEELRNQLHELRVQLTFGLQRFSGSDEDLRFYTSFEHPYSIYRYLVNVILHIRAFNLNQAKLGVFSGVKYDTIRGCTKPASIWVDDEATWLAEQMPVSTRTAPELTSQFCEPYQETPPKTSGERVPVQCTQKHRWVHQGGGLLEEEVGLMAHQGGE